LGGIANISVANAIYQFDHQTLVAGLSGAIMSSVFNYAVTRAFTWK
jgi:dolichol-phosphate mannosyltransferase